MQNCTFVSYYENILITPNFVYISVTVSHFFDLIRCCFADKETSILVFQTFLEHPRFVHDCVWGRLCHLQHLPLHPRKQQDGRTVTRYIRLS